MDGQEMLAAVIVICVTVALEACVLAAGGA